MTQQRRGRALVIALALLAWFGVLLQLGISVHTTMQNGKGIASGIISYLGYFTILTNLLVSISLTLPLIAPQSAAGRFFARSEIIAGVATSILFVGLAYFFLLRNSWNPKGLELLANALLHYVVPPLYLLYWWFATSKGGLRFTHPLLWGAYPTLYLAYALIRGSILGSYPYAFIDAASIGYEQTLLNGLGLLLVFIVLGLSLVGLGRMQRRASP